MDLEHKGKVIGHKLDLHPDQDIERKPFVFTGGNMTEQVQGITTHQVVSAVYLNWNPRTLGYNKTANRSLGRSEDE